MAEYFPNTEPKKQISLYQALPNKYEKIEYIIQKGVEIGIHRFIFFRSDRSQKLILSTSKMERFISIAREALEQCGGLTMPEILFLEKMPDTKNEETHIVLDTTGNITQLRQYESLSQM